MTHEELIELTRKLEGKLGVDRKTTLFAAMVVCYVVDNAKEEILEAIDSLQGSPCDVEDDQDEDEEEEFEGDVP